jgi:hypothetical protein
MLAAVFLLSLALLAYQVVLVHLLSIRHWTHFAALVISLALLGFGASGSALALARRRVAGRERSLFTAALIAAALSFDPAYRLSAAIPFDAFELLAVPRQLVYLPLTYLALGIPFFLGAAAIAVAFAIEPGRVARVYAANLAGSGAGAAAALVLLERLPAEWLTPAVGLAAALAPAALAARAGVSPRLRAAAGIGACAVAALAVVSGPAPLPVSAYKDESVALAQAGARLLAQRDGALGRLRVVAGPALRYLPGASLTLTAPVPPRPVLYLNGQPLGARSVAADSSLYALTTTAALFAIPPKERSAAEGSLLLIGLDGGGEVWLARARGARRITAVDPDRRIDSLLAPGTLGPDVSRIARDARGYLHGTADRYERILVSGLGSIGGVSAGMASAGEDYLFTVEGVRDLWRALDRDGALAVTRWVLEPPRDVLRLVATVRTVLDGEGVRAADHVALVRGWGTATLLVTRRPLDAARVAGLSDWCRERWFDLAWAPGVGAAEANVYNILDPDVFHAGAEALLGLDPRRFLASYPFDVAPVTDDAPFFHHFLPFAELVRLWRAEGRLSLPYFEWGLVAQALALAQAIPLAAVLILLPLASLSGRPRSGSRAASADRGSAAEGAPAPVALFLYFALLGLAYMLLEISFIQRLILLLGQPVYATAVVLASFLLFAGLGSVLAPGIAARAGTRFPFVAIALTAGLAFGAQGWLWGHVAAAPMAARLLLAGLLLAPLAFFMGMPFPLGLQRVSDRRSAWVAWCWGVNGFLSVVGAAAAPLVALELGFRGVLILAVGLYLLAAWMLDRL